MARMVYRHLLEILDPVARQSVEIETGYLSVYLQALEFAHAEKWTDHQEHLETLEERLRDGPECLERRFFLMVRLVHQIGEYLGRTVIRPKLQALRREAEALNGMGLGNRPMRLTALNRLTAEAVRFRQFDLAETWLAEALKEADMLNQAPGISMESLKVVTSLIESLPLWVKQEKERFQRAEAAGLE